jgi:hypothetical protein
MHQTFIRYGREGEGVKAQLLAVEQADGTFCAYLVDEHSVFVSPLDGTGVDSLHYATAITLLGCSPGELFIDSPDENGSAQILAPRPNVLSIVDRNKMKKIGLAARGIHPLAAEVLLRLAASLQNVQVPFTGAADWTFGKPIKRNADPNVMAGTTPEKFFCAWLWSRWVKKGTGGVSRLADMKSIGYLGSESGLRNMLSDLGLVSTKLK